MLAVSAPWVSMDFSIKAKWTEGASRFYYVVLASHVGSASRVGSIFQLIFTKIYKDAFFLNSLPLTSHHIPSHSSPLECAPSISR